jgi:hypothetical protein
MRSHFGLAAAVATALLFSPRIARAADSTATVTISAGDEKEICTAVKPVVTPESATLKLGTWRIDGDPKGETAVRVVYKAKDTAAAGMEAVTCAVGADKRVVTVTVIPKAGASSPEVPKPTTDAGPRNSVTGFSDLTYPEAFKALFLLFVLATVLESALAILFNWRPFVETFNARAVRPVVSLAFALMLVFLFNLDLVTALAKLVSPNVPALDATGRILTAMVIAGGSAAVNNLMVGLGFRQVRTPETVTPKPPADKGWISVSITRTPTIKGAVTIGIGVADASGNVPVVASLEQSSRRGYRYFFRDPGRFPGSGGYPVKKADVVTVRVSAAKSDGSADPLVKTWGPNAIADGAIIDLKFDM